MRVENNVEENEEDLIVMPGRQLKKLEFAKLAGGGSASRFVSPYPSSQM